MQLSINSLSKRYRSGVQALKDVSLTIETGMFGLLGPNGAGKSTLMRIIATLQEADSGSIRLDDLDVLEEKDGVRKLLGYLPQEFGLYPKIALALLGDPKLIIVDEPTAGLDPEERVRFHNVLSEIGENVIVILSTHIVGDVTDLCGRMAIIHRGEVVSKGEPLSLADDLQGRVWKQFISRTDLPKYHDEYQVISTRLLGGRLLIHVYSKRRPEGGFDEVTPDLHDVYFCAIKQHDTKQAQPAKA